MSVNEYIPTALNLIFTTSVSRLPFTISQSFLGVPLNSQIIPVFLQPSGLNFASKVTTLSSFFSLSTKTNRSDWEYDNAGLGACALTFEVNKIGKLIANSNIRNFIFIF